jgi:hypothetical protein
MGEQCEKRKRWGKKKTEICLEFGRYEQESPPELALQALGEVKNLSLPDKWK